MQYLYLAVIQRSLKETLVMKVIFRLHRTLFEVLYTYIYMYVTSLTRFADLL